MNYILEHNLQTILKIYVQPNANENAIVGFFGEPARIKIKIKALPRDGEANAEIIAFISKLLKVSKSKVEIYRGESARQKDLLIDLPFPVVSHCILEAISRIKAPV